MSVQGSAEVLNSNSLAVEKLLQGCLLTGDTSVKYFQVALTPQWYWDQAVIYWGKMPSP